VAAKGKSNFGFQIYARSTAARAAAMPKFF